MAPCSRYVVAAVLDGPPALEHQHLEAALGEFLGGPAAGDAGADDDGVEVVRFHPYFTPVQSLDQRAWLFDRHVRVEGPGTSSYCSSCAPPTSEL